MDAYRENGIRYIICEAIPHIHNHYVRDLLYRKKTTLNDVEVRYRRVGDRIVPWQAGHPNPESYEFGIVEALRTHLRKGDDVVIIGGGWGVSTTVAALEVGSVGSVLTYEASPKQAERVQETTKLNEVDDRVTVENSVVSHTVSIYGSETSSRIISPENIPECDVLELDCEGAEKEILCNLEIRPRVIIVETHGVFDSPTMKITNQLKEMGYAIESTQLAESGEMEEMCRERDVKVVVAIYNDS